jgi:hypothetical protein
LGEFSPEQLNELVSTLTRAGIGFVVIGGQAVAEELPTYT